MYFIVKMGRERDLMSGSEDLELMLCSMRENSTSLVEVVSFATARDRW